jgi:hypothetical protein
MNFAVKGGVDAEAALEVRAGDRAEVTAGAGAKAEQGNNKKSTSQPIYEQSTLKGGDQYATGR